MARRPVSLTTRLVATVVVLLALVCLVVTGATAVAMHRYLYGRLDDQVTAALTRAAGPEDRDFALPSRPPLRLPDTRAGSLAPDPGERGERSRDGDREDADDRVVDLEDNLLGQGGGTVLAFLPGPGEDDAARGLYVPSRRASTAALDGETLRRLAQVPVDGRPRTVEIEIAQTGREVEAPYRVLAATGPDGAVLLVGLPTGEVTRTVRSIAFSGLGLTGLGVLLAGLIGWLIVRRQLRPLRQVAATADAVAAQQLGSGEIDLRTRVPAHLADGRTEVGQVGAALNTLLGHVESSLEQRHASEQRVRRFVADASHELRTPLTTIAGYAQLARRTPDDAAALLAALSRVEDQSGRMKDLVEDLLLLARLDSGRPLERAEVDLTRLLLESVADARVVAPDHAWRLDLPEEAVAVLGDEGRLHQVVANLLSNAARHTPPGTTITASARPDAAGVLVSVHDDGPGLAPDLVPGAFDRFTRGDSSRTRASGGAGLGLSLVRAIAEAHGGTVAVDSRPGDTAFTVRLPG